MDAAGEDPVLEVLATLSGRRSARLIRRFDHGVGGTSLIELDGKSVVLKSWVGGVDVAPSLALMQIMIDRGIPAPALLEQGRVGHHDFLIYEYVNGVWPAVVTGPILHDLFAVVDAERGAAPIPNAAWRSELQQMLTVGDPAFDIDPHRLVEHPDGRFLLDEARRRLESCPDHLLRTDDVVHADFAPENVLVRDAGPTTRGRLVSVVDWERCRTGDAGIDIVGMIFDLEIGDKADRGVLDALWTQTQLRMEPPVLGLYMAVYAVRYASWAVGTEMEDEVVELGRRLLGRTGT